MKRFRQFDLLYVDVENMFTSLTVDYLLKGLVWYLFPVDFFQKNSVQYAAVWKHPAA